MKIDSYIKELKNKYKFYIENSSTDDYILFDCSYNQPFEFSVQIYFSEIFNKPEFGINVPAANLKKEEIKSFSETIKQVTEITTKLNQYLEEYKKERNDKM